MIVLVIAAAPLIYQVARSAHRIHHNARVVRRVERHYRNR